MLLLLLLKWQSGAASGRGLLRRAVRGALGLGGIVYRTGEGQPSTHVCLYREKLTGIVLQDRQPDQEPVELLVEGGGQAREGRDGICEPRDLNGNLPFVHSRVLMLGSESRS